MQKRILVISPHPDDETISVGGTISKLISEGSEVFVLTVSGHLPPLYERSDFDTTVDEAKEAYKILGVTEYRFLEIPATMIGDEPIHKLNGKIASVIDEFLPQVVCNDSNCEVVDKQGNIKGYITNKELQKSLTKS